MGLYDYHIYIEWHLYYIQGTLLQRIEEYYGAEISVYHGSFFLHGIS